MTETTERFLQEIAARVGYDRVAELYLFPVLRQGGVEGAVAVVAAHPEPTEGTEPAEQGESAAESVQAAESTADAADESAALADAVEEELHEAIEADGAETVGESVEAPVASVDRDADVSAAADESGAEEPLAAAAAEPAPVTRSRARHVVYTARYRHTIKGPDRGRWIVEVVAEADAPLITVEEVVRGVVRRSGDEFQPERLSGEQFRALVPAPAAPGSAPA